MDRPTVQKVVIYCVREGKLLVFRHVHEEAGIQVPAGTVRQGESFKAAALRELCEETNLDCFEIEAFLGTSIYDQSPYRNELHERHFFRARPTAPLPERWRSFERHDGLQLPTEFECYWIPIGQGHILSAGLSVLLWRLAE